MVKEIKNNKQTTEKQMHINTTTMTVSREIFNTLNSVAKEGYDAEHITRNEKAEILTIESANGEHTLTIYVHDEKK